MAYLYVRQKEYTKTKEEQEILNKFRKSYAQNILAIAQEYQDILIQKYNQTVYTNDWGEIVFDDFLREMDYFVSNIVPRKFDYTKLAEYSEIEDWEIEDEFFNFVIQINSDKTKIIEYDEANNKLICKISFRIEETDKYMGVRLATCFIVARYLDVIISMGIRNNSNNIRSLSSPIDYEKQIAADLRKLGFNARTTKGSGDQGADVLVSKDGVSFAIQCKMYSKPVGNKAVQEANAGRDFYKKDYGVVVSNAGFTKSARQAARACGIILLNDNKLSDLLEYVKS